ncbi:MAG TPA: sulfide/dihydroorotate dehydrogenase-like FAD/NAD-binding protein, partial [Spirochaetota bacterium]
ISLVFQEMGKSTKLFAAKKSGDTIMDFLGPQGNPSEIENFGRVVIVGGGVGIAPVFPIARALSGSKNHVIAVIGYRSKENVFWEEKMRSVASELVIMTNDGSYGRKGFVTDALSDIINEQKPDRIIAIGPAVMMKAVSELTRPSQVKTIVSLNSLMVCGMGMCGACRVTVGDKTRFTCMDGPEFDGHQVDYDELISRLATYKDEEKICLENYESEECVRET